MKPWLAALVFTATSFGGVLGAIHFGPDPNPIAIWFVGMSVVSGIGAMIFIIETVN